MNKEERLKIYEQAKEYLESDASTIMDTLCSTITALLKIKSGCYDMYHMTPELYTQCPVSKDQFDYWWARNKAGKAKRIQALENAIALCQNS